MSRRNSCRGPKDETHRLLAGLLADSHALEGCVRTSTRLADSGTRPGLRRCLARGVHRSPHTVRRGEDCQHRTLASRHATSGRRQTGTTCANIFIPPICSNFGLQFGQTITCCLTCIVAASGKFLPFIIASARAIATEQVMPPKSYSRSRVAERTANHPPATASNPPTTPPPALKNWRRLFRPFRRRVRRTTSPPLAGCQSSGGVGVCVWSSQSFPAYLGVVLVRSFASGRSAGCRSD